MKSVSAYWHQLYLESQSISLKNEQVTAIQKNDNLEENVKVATQQESWLPSPAKGIKRLALERDGGEKTTRATSIVAYEPNSKFAAHEHPRGEEFFVLSGTFSDEHGDYPAGTYVRNPPGSSHQPYSTEGCLIFVKLQQFSLEDNEHVVIETDTTSLGKQHSIRHVLFDQYETVETTKIRKGETLMFNGNQGLEILVLDGKISVNGETQCLGDWLRVRSKNSRAVTALEDSIVYVKYGHLA